MSGRSVERPTTIEALQDEELAQLEHATPGPWNDTATEAFTQPKPHRHIPKIESKPTARHVKSQPAVGEFLPVVPTGSNNNARELIRQAKLAPRHLKGRMNSSAVTKAYDELVSQSEAMELARASNMHRRQLHAQALLLGIEQLSPERVQAEKELIRFNALKNEVDIFQQYLDPFVFEIRTPREHSVRSSVYRHFVRMQGIQDMGIPIYSLGSYSEEPNDKILLPRTFESFYRRIRRRNAADFTDANLVTQPTPHRPARLKAGHQGGGS